MIERVDYRKTHLGFDSISQRELDQLVQLANTYLLDYYGGFLVTDSMGEIIPLSRV
jgi:hypothetical protein